MLFKVVNSYAKCFLKKSKYVIKSLSSNKESRTSSLHIFDRSIL